MNTSKFLEEIKVIENKFRQKAGEESNGLGFPALVQQLAKSEQLDNQIVDDLKELWTFRNKIYSSSTPDDKVSPDTQSLLARIISNPNLQ